MPENTNTIAVACSCGKRLKAPSTAIGKKARCPACGNSVLINPPPQNPDDDEFGAMFELADQATTTPASADSPRCPQCRGEMDPAAVVCMNCGYNTRTGQSSTFAGAPSAAPARKSNKIPSPAKQIDRMAPEGSLVLGIILSAIFALLASVVWIVVAWLTGFALAIIAILIGAAAGIGMQIGHKGYSQFGGYIASAMTLLAIFLAKLIVLEVILVHAGLPFSFDHLNHAKLAYYFFNPIGLIIIAVGLGAAFRTANGISRN